MRFLIFLMTFMSSATYAVDPISTATDPVVVYKVQGEIEEIKFDLELAIAGKGLKITNTLHISDMLTRTAKEAGMPEHPYQLAESLEFCSAVITHKMTQAHAANLASCPLTISIYALKSEPGKTYLAFQQPNMAGASQGAEDDLLQLLDGIIQETLE